MSGAEPSVEQQWLAFTEHRLDLLGAGESNLRPFGPQLSLTKSRIDEELRSAQRAVELIKTHRLAFQAVYRLPPEVLAHIFVIHAIKYPHYGPNIVQGDYIPLERRPLGWIRVSHVCRSWRMPALGAKRLWSDIPYHNLGPKWGHAFLERAGGIPLNWETAINHAPLSPSAANLVKEHLPHIQRLCLKVLPADQDEIETLNLGDRAPYLTYLSVKSIHKISIPSTNWLPIFAPLLNDLTIESISLPLRNAHWPILRNLQLRDMRLDLNDLLTAISSASSLTRLTIVDVTPSSSFEPPQSCISLNGLEYAEFRLEHDIAVSMQKSLIIPSTTIFQVHYECSTSGLIPSDAYSDVSSVVLNRLLHVQGHGGPIDSIVIDECLPDTLTIVHTHKQTQGQDVEPGYKTATNSFRLDASLGYDLRDIISLLLLLSLHTCSSLDVRSGGWWDEEAWSILLPRLPLLENIKLSGSCGRTFLRVVEPSASHSDGSVLLPRLNSMTFHSLIIESSYDSIEDRICPVLEQYLKERIGREDVISVQNIAIRSCCIRDSDMLTLERLGVKVDWVKNWGVFAYKDSEEDGDYDSDY